MRDVRLQDPSSVVDLRSRGGGAVKIRGGMLTLYTHVSRPLLFKLQFAASRTAPHLTATEDNIPMRTDACMRASLA